MKKTKTSKLLLAVLASGIFSLAASAQAMVIVETVQEGHSNAPFTSQTYWRVTYTGEPSSFTINSITIDLRAGGQNSNAVFDLVGGSSPYGPVIGAISGFASGDVTFSPNSGTGFYQLTLSFTPGVFSVGDYIHFGADYDNLDISDTDGDVPGQTSVGVSVTYSNNQTVSGFFQDVDADGTGGVNDGISRATLTTPVPEPGSVLLLLLGAGAIFAKRRRK